MTFKVWDRIQDWVIFFALLVVAVATMAARNEPVVRGLRAASLETTSWVEARFAWAGGYFRALEENSLLREENIDLSSEVALSREAQSENERLRTLLGFRDSTELRMHAARVVNKDWEQNLLTIDAGAADSVKLDMPVVDDRGIIGKVVLVSEHYARVMPYLNTDFLLPARILPFQAEGILKWEGQRRDQLLLDHIPRTEPVIRGQLVVTSGYSGAFPSSFPVGYVDSVATKPGRPELLVYVRPTSPIDRAEYVFVILERPDPERVELESRPIQ